MSLAVDENRILVISNDCVGFQMAGPGIRYYHLARVLSREFPVTLAVPAGSAHWPQTDFPVFVYRSEQEPALEQAVREARVILVQGVLVAKIPALQQTAAALVIDGYDPFLAETLSLHGDARGQQAALTQAYLAGDFFVCASERQRDWWLGLLEANGRVNCYTHGEDPSLRRLVDLLPFGLPEMPPEHLHDTVKGVWPGIGKTDRVILWGGGLWQWLDPLTAIRAVACLWQEHQDIRLIFPGTQHPNPIMAGMPTQNEAAVKLADQMGLLNRAVFFGDWVPFDEWQNVLLESDMALSLHASETYESRLAFRSRVLDYIWAGLPVVATSGDATSELIDAYDLGILVENTSVEQVADAIRRLLDTPRSVMAPQFQRAQSMLTWERAARSLIEFCRAPRRAPDKVALGEKLGDAFCIDRVAKLSQDTERLQRLVRAYEGRRAVRVADQVHNLGKRLGLVQ